MKKEQLHCPYNAILCESTLVYHHSQCSLFLGKCGYHYNHEVAKERYEGKYHSLCKELILQSLLKKYSLEKCFLP